MVRKAAARTCVNVCIRDALKLKEKEIKVLKKTKKSK